MRMNVQDMWEVRVGRDRFIHPPNVPGFFCDGLVEPEGEFFYVFLLDQLLKQTDDFFPCRPGGGGGEGFFE